MLKGVGEVNFIYSYACKGTDESSISSGRFIAIQRIYPINPTVIQSPIDETKMSVILVLS
jgi:hypothetical protein